MVYNAKMKLKQIHEHFKKNDPIVYEYIKDVDYSEWFEESKTEKDYFVALCHAIVGQQLSGKAARSIFNKFKLLFDKEIIKPEKILEMNAEDLRSVGLSWGKVRYIKDLAAKALDNSLELKTLEELPDEEVIEKLITVKGIGRWTAEMFLMFTLKRENVFSHGDLGLNKGFCKIYNIEDPEKEEIEEVIKKWAPYKTFGAIALWHSLDNM